jgi:diguanylate cyclase (GGDEF)-like protein
VVEQNSQVNLDFLKNLPGTIEKVSAVRSACLSLNSEQFSLTNQDKWLDTLQVQQQSLMCSLEGKELISNCITEQGAISLSTLLDSIGEAVIVLDNTNTIHYMNPTAIKMIDLHGNENKPIPLSGILQVISEINLDFSDPSLASIHDFADGIGKKGQTIVNTNNQGQLCINYTAIPIQTRNQSPSTSILIIHSPSQIEQLENNQGAVSSYDPLTGLINRTSFETILQQALNSAKTNGQNHVLCYVDLDRFKVLNDTCGHAAGDELLRQLSLLFQKRVRKSDVLSRLGSDEFGLIFYQCNLEQAINVVQSLISEVENHRFIWNKNEFKFTISIGLITIDTHFASISHILTSAESACNAAKARGRNRLHIYQYNDLELESQRGEIRWVPRIFKALDENQFCLYYQPIASLKSSPNYGKEGFDQYREILIRLKDPAGKIVLPGEFLPSSERYGLMHLIDRWVIQTLFSLLSERDLTSKEDTLNSDDCLYTINLSGASLNDDQFLDFVYRQFSAYSVSPKNICFEITETIAITNYDKAIQTVQCLKSFGCKFALDDFGTGMSSFGYLKYLPVDYLKIDGIFIKDMIHCEVAREIVKSISRIAHVLEIQTIAEFVENEQILLKLIDMDIDYAQGYGIAKPVPLLNYQPEYKMSTIKL